MVCKKYSAEFKRKKVEEYLYETKEKKITKAEFALRNNISDSTFNDWVLKYERDKQGFCNITNEIVKLGNNDTNIDKIEATDYLIRTMSDGAETYITDKDYIRLHYNGVVLEFNEILLDRVIKIVKEW